MAQHESPRALGIVLLEDADFMRLRERSTNTANTTTPRTNFTVTDPSREAYTQHESQESSPVLLVSDDISVSNQRESGAAHEPHNSKSTLRISITPILVGILLGLVLGVILNFTEPSPLLVQWIQLPGDLFLRAIKCLMVPYIFCAVAVAIGDLVFVGKVSVVGYQTAKMFVLQWLTVSVLGMILALSFRPYFRSSIAYDAQTTKSAIMGLTCINGKFAQLQPNGTVACRANELNTTTASATAFFISDVKGEYKTNGSPALRKLTVSQQLMTTITEAISANIFASLSRGDLLSIITFAMILGTIAGRQYFTRSREINYVYLTLFQVRNTFFLMLEWVIALTPVAVISLIAGSFAESRGALRFDLANCMYITAMCLGATLQMFILFPAMVFFMTRCNPYKYLLKMTEAYAFAFACSSSLATAPVTLWCVNRAKVCSRSLSNFVVSLGVCSNTSSSGSYYPIAVVFLIESSGLGDVLTPWRLVLLFVLTVIACAGTPPIPYGGIVIMTTIFRAVTGVEDVPPQAFAFMMAAEVIVDRVQTVCNVNDDIMALKVVAETTDETVTAEYLGERF